MPAKNNEFILKLHSNTKCFQIDHETMIRSVYKEKRHLYPLTILFCFKGIKSMK